MLFAALCWALWCTRNKLTIESVVPKHPTGILFKMLTFIQTWANLSKEQDKADLVMLANGLKAIYRSTILGSDGD